MSQITKDTRPAQIIISFEL